jgi:hypothetical protein
MAAPPRPKPIRYDVDTWLVMRNDPVIPKAVIQRVRHRTGSDKYLLFKWDLDPTKRKLMNVVDTLDKADNLVRYELPQPGRAHAGPPNGLYANGTRITPEH